MLACLKYIYIIPYIINEIKMFNEGKLSLILIYKSVFQNKNISFKSFKTIK